MKRRFPVTIPVLAVLGCCVLCGAQQVGPSAAAPSKERAAPILLGQALIPLNGPWKFRIGDSPVDSATGKRVWADPAFDDSAWETVDLEPGKGTRSSNSGDTGYVPGWTAKGHAGYWGYAWYRLRVPMETQPGQRLALMGPADVDDAYQVFANGIELGSFGDFSGNRPIAFYNQPLMFAVPSSETSANAEGQSSSTQVFALRVWMEPNALLISNDPGGLHSAPMLGEASAVAVGYQMRRLERFRYYSSWAVEALLYALLAVVAFSLILFDRSDMVYLWMGAVFLLTAGYSGLDAFDVWTMHLSIRADALITEDILSPLAYAGWLVVWWVWFGRQRPKWLAQAAAGLTAVYMISYAIGNGLFFTLVPQPVATSFEVVSLVVRLLSFALMLWIVIQGIRRQGVEGWLVLPAIVLLGIGMFQNELALIYIRLEWYPFGVRFTLAQIANLLLAAEVALLLLRRLLLSVRRQRLISFSLKQGQLQSDFVSAVSHEFRSPLTSLRSITELLAQNRIPDESRRKQSYVLLDRETTRLHRLVEDLLDFGRMESGRKQYRMQHYDAFDLVRATLADFHEQAELHRFCIEADLGSSGGGAAARVQVDEEAFCRAVRNLLENAMKYSPDCRTIWVDGTVRDRHVLISVRDRGMGIDTDEQGAIFQKFVRGDAAKRAGINGTGIGLAMVKQISEAMGGEVQLQSEVGVGSTFTIVLPLAGE